MNKYALGDRQGAISDMTKALRVKPHFYEVMQLRAMFYLETKDIAKCLADCNTLLSHDKNDQVALLLRGQCHMAQKNHKLAVKDFNTCSDLDPTMKDLWLYRGVANYYLAQDKEAIVDLTKALQTSPDDPVIYYMLGACKNNLQPGTGCDDLRKSIKLGNPDAARMIKDECK
jgi:lipoprotein NlpI